MAVSTGEVLGAVMSLILARQSAMESSISCIKLLLCWLIINFKDLIDQKEKKGSLGF